MDLTKLNHSVQSQIRSDMMIYNVSRCVTELVENAIDAEATCIAVKIDLTKFQIQVVDNGSGISREHLNSIGTRYWSTKCCQTDNSKKYTKPHDNRGEFLASIKNSCSRLMIVTRAVGDEITYCKVFDESKTGTVVKALHQRASKGTTIIINNFFGNLPVRQKRIVPAVEIQNTKRCIQGISLMYPSILFILKDDAKNVEILRIPRTSSTSRTFRFLFPQVIDQHSSMIKVVADERNVSMRAMICREAYNNRDLQFVFVNKRFMIKSEIRSMLNEMLSKKGFFEGVSKNTDDVSQPRPQQQRQKSALSKMQPRNAIFILNICCRPDEYRVTFLPDKRQVDFKDRTKIKHCLIKLVDSFWQQGLFEDSSVPPSTAVALPEKSKSTFMPRLLFEKMNKIRTIRGAPACRKVAAKIGSEECSNADTVEISRPDAIDEARRRGALEGLRRSTSPNLLAQKMPHRNSASSPSILEPSEQVDSRPLFQKFGQTNQYVENEKPMDSGVKPTHLPVTICTPCTPPCILPPDKPILSTAGLLNRENLRRETVAVGEKSIPSILNTSRIYQKLLSLSVKAREIEISECNSKSSFILKATNNEECVPSCCIQTNSNIRLYDVKRKFHVRKKKTSSRACKLEGLRKIKLKEKNRPAEVDFPKRKNLEQVLKKTVVLKESVLQIDDSLYEPKIQPFQLPCNPKLTSQHLQKIVFDWDRSDESAKVALLNPVKKTQISKSSLVLDGRDEDEALVQNQKQSRAKSIESLVPKLNLETVSRTNQNETRKPIPAVDDFFYAPNLKTSKDFEMSEAAFKSFHSNFNSVSRGILLESPEIFTSRYEISQIPSSFKIAPDYEKGFSKKLSAGKDWFSPTRLNFFPALQQQQKSTTEKSCKVPQCSCSCHTSTCPATVQKESSTLVAQISPALLRKKSTEGHTFAEDFSNYSRMIPVSTNGNAVCGSNAAKTTSLGIFSELAELYSVTRKTEASRCPNTCISRPPAESVDGVQNQAEVLPVFSQFCNEKLPNKMAHDSCNLLTLSMNRCSVKSCSAEVSSNYLNTFCNNTGDNFRLAPSTSRGIFSDCGGKVLDTSSRGPGPNDPTQLASNPFGEDEDNFSIGSTPAPYSPTQLADDSFSVNLEEFSNDTPQAYTLSQLANDSFCVNLERSWIGNTPAVRFFTQFSRDSAGPEKFEFGKVNPVGARDSIQLTDGSFPENLEDSKLCRSDLVGTVDLTQFTSDSFSTDVENFNIPNIGPDDDTQLAKNSFSMELENSKVSNAVGTNDPTQMANDTFPTDLENAKINNTVEVNDHTQIVDDSIGMDLTSSIVSQTPCANTEEPNQLETNEEICHENDLLIEKMLCRKNSKFLGAASIFDIPKGILDVQGTKSKPNSFEKSQKIDFNKFTKPCSMKNHLTFDDYGNSCLRIFPLMKEIIESKEDDFKFDYGNFPEDLNCSIIFSKADLKSVQFLAQLENKFLLSSLVMNDSRDQIIVMFDQHAVDERIRVERLSKEYINEKGVWRSVSVNETICIRVSRCEMSVILDFREDFCSRGIDFDFTDVEENSKEQFSIKVIRVPLCLHNRASREATKSNTVTCLKQLTESLIEELTHTLIKTRGISRSTTPQILQNIINSEACRGAVKFGEQLSSDICSTLLQSLWSCNMPFQCAHGRPLLAPLANVTKLAQIGKQKFPKRTFDELKIQLL